MTDGRSTFVAGASRSGKTTWVLHQLRRDRRVAVYDPKGDFARAGYFPVTTPAELVAELRAQGRRGRVRVAYIPQRDARAEFDAWCQVVWAWRAWAPITVVADELATVTPAGRAPGAWHTLTSQGLGAGITLYAISQRPAESDKTSIDNATIVRVGRANTGTGKRYAADLVAVPVQLIDDLGPGDFIERDAHGRRWRCSWNPATRRESRIALK